MILFRVVIKNIYIIVTKDRWLFWRGCVRAKQITNSIKDKGDHATSYRWQLVSKRLWDQRQGMPGRAIMRRDRGENWRDAPSDKRHCRRMSLALNITVGPLGRGLDCLITSRSDAHGASHCSEQPENQREIDHCHPGTETQDSERGVQTRRRPSRG